MLKQTVNDLKHPALNVILTIALLMLFTLLPPAPGVYAAGNPTTEAELIAALNAAGGGVTTLGSDITLDDSNAITVKADTTLEIPSGKTLTITGTNGIQITGAALTVTGGGTLNISNTAVGSNGIQVNTGATLVVTGDSILDISNTSINGGSGIKNSGTLVLESCTVDVTNTAGAGITNAAGANLTVSGASVSLRSSGTYGINNSGAVTLSEGTISVETTALYGIFIDTGASLHVDQAEGAEATLEIENSSNKGVLISSGSMTLSAGTVSVKNSGTYGIYNDLGTITVAQAESVLEVKNSANTGIANIGTMTLYSGTVSIAPGSESAPAMMGINNSGTLNATGADIDIAGFASYGCIYNTNTANLSGGTVNIRNSESSGIRNTSSLNLNGAEVNISNSGTDCSGIYNYNGATTLSAGTLTIENTGWYGIFLYDGIFVPEGGSVILNNGPDSYSICAGYAGASVDWSGVDLLLWYQGNMSPTTLRADASLSTLYYGTVLNVTDGTGKALTPSSISTGSTGHSWFSEEPVSGRYAMRAGDVVSVNGGTLSVDQVAYILPPERPINFPGGVFTYQAPGLTDGTADRTASSEAAIQFSSTKEGNFYYQIDGTAPENAVDLISSAGETQTLMSFANTLTLTGLSPGEHTLYIAGEDIHHIAGNVLSVTLPFPPAVEFQVTAPASVLIGTPASITVEALDDIGDTAAGYRGTISFTSSDTDAGLPTGYTFTAGDNGTHTFTDGLTLNTAGSQTITVTDTADDTVLGTAQITVNKYAPSLTLSADLTSPQSYPQSIVLTAELSGADDNAGKTITFSVNGETYDAVTDSDGIAAYTVDSPVPDDYDFEASFAGDGSNDSADAADITGYSINKGTQTGFSFTDSSPSEDYSPSFSYTNTASGGQGTGNITYSITGGTGRASIDPDTGEITEVSAAGTFVVTAVKAADSNYNQAAATYTLTVLKIDPAVTFPTSATVTYGQPLSSAVFSGQSGAGVFAYTSGSTVPTVSGTLYEVTFTPDEYDIYHIMDQDVPIIIHLAGVAVMPSASPAGGAYTGVQTVTLTTGTVGANIYYTTDGSSPTAAGTLYAGPISITPGTTLKAFAVKAGMADSAVMTAIYTQESSSPHNNGGNETSPGLPADTATYIGNGSGTGISLPVTVDKSKNTATVDTGTQLKTVFHSQGKAVISVPAVTGVNSYALGIPAEYLSGTDGEGILTFKSGLGSISLTGNMLAGVAGTEGKNAKITIGEGDKTDLPEDVKAALGDKPLIQLSLAIDGKTTEWNNPDAPVTVSIPYTPAAEELANPEAIIIWYIDGSGKAVPISNGHYDPASGTVTFTTDHFSSYAVAYNKVNFSDVPAGSWYNKAVGFIAARDISAGTGNGRYSPNAKLTRGQFLVMMMRAYNIEPDENSADNFADSGSTWYTGYLAAAKRLRISGGTGDNLFGPEKEITRQEMFTLLYNGLKAVDKLPVRSSTGKSLSDFSDAEQIAPWAKEALTLLTETGNISGSNGRLAPENTTTRSEMAQVLYRLLSE